jgi:ribosomal protein L29
MIILTIRRERDINELRELVEEQRLRLAELRAWLAGRNASQTRRIGSERKPHPEPTANVKASESGMPVEEPRQSRPSEDDVARETKALEWQREVAARLQSGLKSRMPPTEQATKPAAEAGFKWFKDEPNEPREIAPRGIVAGLGNTNQPRAHDSLESKTIGPNTELNEVERTLRAIRSLRDK